jgi:hypothetical protein
MIGFMKKILLFSFFVWSAFACAPAWCGETIVLFRHAEKPAAGLGQLSCQGLRRALALPDVLIPKYGRPLELFAPNPSEQKLDRGILYAYIRPLATIEPTAIRLEMPVNLSYSINNYSPLVGYLLGTGMENSTFFVAWEHHQIDAIAKLLIEPFDKELAQTVKHWQGDDFDSIYRITLEGKGDTRKVSFAVDQQKMSNLLTTCPGAKVNDAL